MTRWIPACRRTRGKVAEAERRELLEIMEDRHGLRPTIWTRQFPVAQWHDHVGDPP